MTLFSRSVSPCRIVPVTSTVPCAASASFRASAWTAGLAGSDSTIKFIFAGARSRVTRFCRSPASLCHDLHLSRFETTLLDHIAQLCERYRVPERKRMSVLAFVRDTSTVSTPGSFCMATRTAWAQTAQSMPSVFIWTRRNSAEGGRRHQQCDQQRRSSSAYAIHRSLLIQPEEVAEIHAEAEPFTGLRPLVR